MGEKSLVSKLVDIDDRYIYIIMMFVFSIPLLYPLGLPITISEYPQTTFNYIEALPPGSIVAISYDVGPGDRQDAGPAVNALLRHAIRAPNVRVVAWSIGTNGPMTWEDAIEDATKEGQVYGEDYVYLGFIPGEETAAAAIANDPWAAFSGKDAYGTSMDQLPLMADFREATDIAMVANSGGSMQWIFLYLRQWQETFGVDWIATGSSKFESTYVAFLPTGQLTSVIAGARHAAEYELLLGEPTLTIASMDAQSVAHLAIVFFMILGNLFYFIQKRDKGGR
jgi:hypothetical protein